KSPSSWPVYLRPFRSRVAFRVFSPRSDHLTSQGPSEHFGLKLHPAVNEPEVLVKPLAETNLNRTLKSPATRAWNSGGFGVFTATETNPVWRSFAVARSS